MKRKQSQVLLIIVFLLAASYSIYLITSSSGSGTLAGKPLSDFAIKDTSKVDKIVIQNADGYTVELTKHENYVWMLNGKVRARKDAADMILKTAHRIRVQKPVPKVALENTLRKIAVKNKKVDFYQDGKLIKTYFVGNPTMDHYGTYMLLEIPGIGRSNEPFVMEIPGFNGHLESRFFVDPYEWRHTGVFNYHASNIGQVKLEDFESPEKSFQIDITGENSFELKDLEGNQTALFDTSKVRRYVINYRKVHFEGYTQELTQVQKDSVIASTPRYKISISDKSGETRSITLFNIKLKTPIEEAGSIIEYNNEKMYGLLDDGELVLVQFFVFRKLLRSYSHFL